MFATYFDDSVRFTNIMVSHSMIMLGTIALNVLTFVLSIGAIVYLDISWADIGLGVLATMGISTVATLVAMAVVASMDAWVERIMENLGMFTVASTVLALVYTTIGFSLFIGLTNALAVVVLPAIITTPMLVSLRSWALRTY
jgi:hypothetical protein